MDLLDLGTRRLSWRRLRNLIRHLPSDADTAVAVAGPAYRWNDTEYLLAAVVDSLHYANWLTSRAHFKGVSKRPPKPVKRPADLDVAETSRAIRAGDTEAHSIRPKQAMTIADIDRELAGLTGRKE